MQPAEPKYGFVARLSALYAAYFMMSGVQLPFFPVWLKAKGLDPGAIGLFLAVPMLVRFAAIPVATGLADRRDALRGILIGVAMLNVLSYVVLGSVQGAASIFAAYALASFFYTPLMPLTDTYALRGLASRGRAYGPVRLWGSGAFILGTFVAGAAADWIDARNLIWLIVGAGALTAVSALLIVPLERTPGSRASAAPRAHLLRDRAFVMIVAAASLIQASHAVFYGFSALAWHAAGLDGTTIAALWALGVIAEIVLFACQARLPAFVTPTVLLLIGAFGGIIRWTAMAFDPPTIMLPVLQLMHGASFGATHLGTLALIARLAPHGQAARAQGYFAIVSGAAMAAASALSGLLYGSFGAGAYGAMALMAVVGGACVLAEQAVARPVMPR